MRHPKRQSWSCALFCVFFLFFFNILTSPAFALPATPSAYISASISASSTSSTSSTQLAPSRNRKTASSAPSAPSPGLGSETPQATEGAAPAPASGASPATSTTAPDERIPQHLIKLEQLEDAGVKAAASLPSPPPYKPIVTPPPDQDSQLAKMGYSMTTFYTCDTIGGQEHCGWHVPVLKADAPTTRTDVRVVLAVVSCLAGILAWGLV
ncbi:hypothetical protein T069G_04348 [Trichoderma breve]|uniref:Uncharacterized protein n=1 Tax=Trichoderma breve TaxID=2034170 RepID=A0A9W9EB02_9HYPO|nr:hypothetical protein T069G_04348 [Trichoderma breve]KAJ4863394.1 hypothetical protein T069G_04348 [Trichoderma breve]